MGSNIAARRAAKAQRRKAVVAEKRKTDLLTNSLAGQVRLAAQLPIQHCLLGDTLFTRGMGTLILARGASPYRVWTGSFLLDAYCLGVKDVFLRELDRDTFDGMLQRLHSTNDMVPVEPSYARKLLRDLVRWSASIGYGPHEDFSTLERIFGTVRAEDCTEEFTFGYQGKPLLIPGPTDFDRHPAATADPATGRRGSGRTLRCRRTESNGGLVPPIRNCRSEWCGRSSEGVATSSWRAQGPPPMTCWRRFVLCNFGSPTASHASHRWRAFGGAVQFGFTARMGLTRPSAP